MSERWYDVAQICQNGHVVTAYVKTSPHKMTKFCDRCGEATMTTCSRCGAEIRGEDHSDLVILSEFKPPAFCHACGKPYPWTEAGLKAAQELAAEMSELAPDERDALAKSLPDLLRETPRTALAATRFKRLVTKAGPVALEGFRKLLVDFGAEAAKKIILGG